jgi:glycosyltransferase involved in cell wall biosynthesis
MGGDLKINIDKTGFDAASGVTAVVSAFRSEKFMEGRMENLLSSSLYAKGRLEIIVIDASSPEAEGDIVLQFADRFPNIRYLRTPAPESVYASWNRGFSMAKGAFVINANTDDRFAFDALECLAAGLCLDSEISATYGNWLVTQTENDGFDSPSKKFLFEYPEFQPPLFLYFQITSHAAMLRRSVFEAVGPFSEQMSVFGDREWMLRFCSAGYRAAKINRAVGLYLINRNGLEASNPKGSEEFITIRERYQSEAAFCSLFGLTTVPAPKELAGLYASAAAMGRNFYRLPAGPVSDYAFSAVLCKRALRLDPTNAAALNNLAGIFMAEAEWSKAAPLLKAASLVADESLKPIVSQNRLRLERMEKDIDTFGWIYA